MFHRTCIPLLERDVFNVDPRVKIYKPLDLNGKHIAFNSYDYRCLKDEVERLSDDIDADFGQVCTTLAGIIKETDNHANNVYPVRENSYDQHRYDKGYLYLRLLDQALYEADSPLSMYELATEVKYLADGHKLSNFEAVNPYELARILKKPVGVLKQLLTVEFNNGDNVRYNRGTFAHRNKQWMYPPLNEDDPEGERVTAFKMTVSINELGCIIKEMTNLREIYFKNDDETFETCYPLLAILGNSNLEKGIFDKNNLTKTKNNTNFATVRYSSHLSSTVTISVRAINAVKDQAPVEITMLNGRKWDILPYAMTQEYVFMSLMGIDLKSKQRIAIRLDRILSIQPSTQKVDTSITKLLPNPDALLTTKATECNITLALGAKPMNESVVEFVNTLSSMSIDIKETDPPCRVSFNSRAKRFVKFSAIPNFVIFEYMEQLHRNGLLIDIYPADVKERYEEYWAGLGKKRYSYQYDYFNWSDNSDDGELTN